MATEAITIIYLTDNCLDEFVAGLCKKYLLAAADGKRIISVSQRPMDFGDNICIGEIGRSGLSIDIQIREGLKETKTPFVGIAEHDCLYTSKHFDFIPLDTNSFFYNDNTWLVQYKNPLHPEYDGMYSYLKRRRVQSQLICGTDALIEATERKIAILSDPAFRKKFPTISRIGEPGTNHLVRSRRIVRGDPDIMHLWADLKDYIIRYNAKDWSSNIPNIDIRHGGNWTGQRRGKQRTWTLSHWGTFASILENNNGFQ